MNDCEAVDYIKSDDFIKDLQSLIEHDRNMFDKPVGWNQRKLSESPLCTSLDQLWNEFLAPIYTRELSGLAYSSIPDPENVIEKVSQLIERIKHAYID